MAAIKWKPVTGEFLFVDVIYEDGSRSSHRKIPGAEVSIFDDEREGSIRAIVEAQDRKIAELSGRSPNRIKTITPSAR